MNRRGRAPRSAPSRRAPKTQRAPKPQPLPPTRPEPLPPIRLGFVRGVAPSKWAERWARAVPEQPLELVPLGLDDVEARREEVDVLLERVAPGAQPKGAGNEPRTRHALRLYEEAVALVVRSDHELAKQDRVQFEELALLELLDHPDHAGSWPDALPWKDPAWMPRNAQATLELVATGIGVALLPLPLARHIADKRSHSVIPLDGPAPGLLPGTEIWASWPVERDGNDIQRLIGVLRGRTPRSSR